MLEVTDRDHTFQENKGDTKDSVLALIKHVGDRVRDCRKVKRISRRELSEKSGVSPRYLAKLEGGDGNISIGLLHKVAMALETPIERFLTTENSFNEEILLIADMYGRANAATRARVLQVLDPEKMRAQKAERICLIGLRGAGKSTLGRRISEEFGVPFIELNAEIEKNVGMPISEIIALYGQEGYRQFEADALTDIIDSNKRAIVAVAGGIVSEENTFFHLLSRFHTVWIKTSAGEHMDRVRAQGDVRPMSGNPQAMIQLRQILNAREEYYEQADHVLDTSGKSVDASQAELSELIQTYKILGWSDRNVRSLAAN